MEPSLHWLCGYWHNDFLRCAEVEARTEIALHDKARAALPKCKSCERKHAPGTTCIAHDMEARNVELMRARIERAEDAFRDVVTGARKYSEAMERLDAQLAKDRGGNRRDA